jgi:hypothetical protein
MQVNDAGGKKTRVNLPSLAKLLRIRNAQLIRGGSIKWSGGTNSVP